MKWNKHWLIPINVLLVLVMLNKGISDKEQIMEKGKSIYLHLAPVDPRSLIQGDYMRLSFAVLDSVDKRVLAKRGFCVLRTDEKGVVTAARFQQAQEPIYRGEYLMKYTTGFNGIQVGAESYFFQEGKAERYSRAAYALIQIDARGNSLLRGFCDSTLTQL
jgi:uncharacterized membrane-anchored protein